MSFSKSKVSRFGEKQDTLPLQRTSAIEFSSRSRESTRSTNTSKNGILSASFNESMQSSENPPRGSLAEVRMKMKDGIARHSCLVSKIGRPNLTKTSSKSRSSKNAEIEGITPRESYTTVDSSKSGPPSTRIPAVAPKSRPNSLGASRAGSFVGSPSSARQCQDFQKRSLEVQFNLKAKRLSTMKMELLEKQRPAIEVYKAMIALRNKLKEMEGKDLPIEELKIVEYPDLKLLDEKQREAEEEKLREMKMRLNTTPTVFMDLCREILDEKCGILDNIFDDDGRWNQDDLIKRIQSYKEESAKLEGHIEGRLKEEEGKMRELIKEWYSIAKVHIGDSYDCTGDLDIKLQETEHRLKQAMADLQIEKAKKNKELFERNRDLERDLAKMKDKIAESNKLLEEERTKAICQKERQSLLEHKMKTAKNKVKDAELQKQNLEIQVDNMSELIRKNEEEWKSKEAYLEMKQKELQQAMKIHKEKVEKLERDRHSIDVREAEIGEEFRAKEQEYLDKIQQLEFELNEVKNQKANLQTEFDSLRLKSVNSEVYNHMQTMNKMKMDSEDSANRSGAEMALWQELKETQSALRLAEEKLALYAEEKTRFLDTISETYEDDASVSLTSQMMHKEEIISSLVLQNKQLQDSLDESHATLNDKCQKMKELDEKVQDMNDQLFEVDVNTEKEIYDLHAKLQCEIERNKELEEQLGRANTDNQNINEMILDYENLLKIRDGLLNMMQEKRQATEEQNSSLKDYIVQMREQLNLMSIDKSKKEQELKTLATLLDEKTGYIDKIEDRVAELESSVQELKQKRVMLQEQICNADGELRVTRDKISRLNQRDGNLQQFIQHAQTLCTQEVIRFRKRLHTHLTLQNSRASNVGLTESANAKPRPQSAQVTRVVTTVSDIMRRYRSNEGFELFAIPSNHSS